MKFLPQDLPPVMKLSNDRLHDELFICALGFEDRCTTASTTLKQLGYKADHVLYLNYETNPDDNKRNEELLLSNLNTFSSRMPIKIDHFFSDPEETIHNFRAFVSSVGLNKIKSVSVDITSFSSSVILQIIDEIIRLPVSNLRIIYTEAAEYYPKISDDINEEFLSHGLRGVITLPNFSGLHSAGYPHLLITFLGYSAVRAHGVYNWYQPTKKIGIIAVPPRAEKKWRAELARKIHEKFYTKKDEIIELSAFDYREVLKELEKIYDNYSEQYNIGIASFGSKLQTVSTLLFLKNHCDIQAVFSIPKSFDAKKYSESAIDIWEIVLDIKKWLAPNTQK